MSNEQDKKPELGFGMLFGLINNEFNPAGKQSPMSKEELFAMFQRHTNGVFQTFVEKTKESTKAAQDAQKTEKTSDEKVNTEKTSSEQTSEQPEKQYFDGPLGDLFRQAEKDGIVKTLNHLIDVERRFAPQKPAANQPQNPEVNNKVSKFLNNVDYAAIMENLNEQLNIGYRLSGAGADGKYVEVETLDIVINIVQSLLDQAKDK